MTHGLGGRAVRSSWSPMVGLFGPRSRYAGGRLSSGVVIDLDVVAVPVRERGRHEKVVVLPRADLRPPARPLAVAR